MTRNLKLGTNAALTQLSRAVGTCDGLFANRWYLLNAAASVGVSYFYARQVVYAYNKDGVKAIANGRWGQA